MSNLSDFLPYLKPVEAPAQVLTPVNITPANGAVGVMSVPLFAGSPYYSLYGKAQTARQVRMSLSAVFGAIEWDSGEVAGADVTVAGPALDGLIANSTIVYWQIRYKDADGTWSGWSQASTFVTSAQYLPTVIGQPFGGGYYAGKIKVGADIYAVITAPKSSETSLQWRLSNASTPGAASTADGFANSNAMNDTLHPAAKHCRDYRGGGHNDWYLPADSELEIQYRAFKPNATPNSTFYGANGDSVPATSNYTAGAPPQTPLAGFKTGGAEAFAASLYWSSTERAAASAGTKHFGDGNNDSASKTTSYVVRPVRRFKL